MKEKGKKEKKRETLRPRGIQVKSKWEENTEGRKGRKRGKG